MNEQELGHMQSDGQEAAGSTPRTEEPAPSATWQEPAASQPQSCELYSNSQADPAASEVGEGAMNQHVQEMTSKSPFSAGHSAPPPMSPVPPAYPPQPGMYGAEAGPYVYARPAEQPVQMPPAVPGGYGAGMREGEYGASGSGYVPPVGTQTTEQSGYTGGTANYYPPVPPQKPKRKNKGLAAFFIVLLCVVIAAGGMTVAYYMGRESRPLNPSSSGEVSYSSSIDVQIQEKPASSNKENPDGSFSVQSVVERMKSSVVSITVYSPDGSAGSRASGVILSEDGYILTNDHIYKDIPNAKFMITLNNGDEYAASFVAGDTRSDISILKMENASGLQSATFGKSSQCQVGEQVVAIGNSAGLVDTVTVGYISALDRRISGAGGYTAKYIQTDTAINPGNSGGPLVNLYGQVIGINSSKIAEVDSEGICFAIPIDHALSIVENLLAHGRVVGRAKLGITYQEISTVAAEINHCPVGLYIATITEDSGLYGKDIAQGDIITHVNGKEITSSNQILDVIDDAKAGDTIRLTIYKSASGASVTVETQLVEYVGESSYTTTPVTPNPTTSMPNYYDDGSKEDFLGPNNHGR